MTEATETNFASDRRILWITYVLYLTVVPAVVGFLITLIKGRAYKGAVVTDDPQTTADPRSILATHHQWLFRTFVAALFLLMAGIGTLYYGVGYVIGGVAVVWWFYRTIRGIVRLAEHKAMPVWH